MSYPFLKPGYRPRPKPRRIAREVRRQLRRRFRITSALALSDIVGAAESSTTTGTADKSCTLPTSGVSVGNLMVLAFAVTDADTTPPTASTPSGWTAATGSGSVITTSFSSPRLYVFYKTIDSVDAAVAVPVSGTCGHVAQAFAIQNAAWGQISTFAVGSGTSNTTNAITAAAGSLLLAVHCNDGGTSTGTSAPTNYTDNTTVEETTITTPGNGIGLAVSARTWGGGSSGTVTRTQSSDEWGNFLIEVTESTAVTITDVETDETFRDGDTALTITGANFEASQGTGVVEIADNADYGSASTIVEQTVTSWADTSIDFTADIGGLTPGTNYLFVTTDSAEQNAAGFAVTIYEAAPTPLANANTTADIDVDTNFRVQARVENSGAADTDTYKWQYYHVEGTATWTDVGTASDVIIVSGSSGLTDGDDALEALGGSGTFLANNNAVVDATDGAFTAAAPLGSGEALETHGSFQIVGADVDDGDTINMRLVKGDGTVLEAYTETVTFTANKEAGTTNNLLADDVESASEVSSPSIGQVHAIMADDVESASEVSAPAVGQVHALTADDVESASEVSAPAVVEVVPLTADDVESASEVSQPAIGQVHALAADDTESASEVSSPAVGQIHALSADDAESASEVSAPSLGQVHALLANDVESASEVSQPALVESTDVLTAEDVESASEVSQPTLGQVHNLLANDIEAASEVSSPVLTAISTEPETVVGGGGGGPEHFGPPMAETIGKPKLPKRYRRKDDEQREARQPEPTLPDVVAKVRRLPETHLEQPDTDVYRTARTAAEALKVGIVAHGKRQLAARQQREEEEAAAALVTLMMLDDDE